MLPQTAIDRTLKSFPAFAEKNFEITTLEKGGSDRKFYRISAGAGPSLILVKYSGNREENRHYVDIAIFLAEAGINVPHIHLHDAAEGLIWMQDLGENDLWAFREESWKIRKPLYESALLEVCKMHTAASRRMEGSGLQLEREFNEQLYLWEQNYFFENCLRAFFGLDEQQVNRYARLPAFLGMAQRLSQLPRSLVHRDFQSQNILVQDQAAWLIDFQGMRPGVPLYDVASLLYDPYVSLSDTERSELLECYKRLATQAGVVINGNFEETFYMCALQRLMQALGAYGFLGLQKGRSDFLAHIPTARQSLRKVAARLDGLDEFLILLDRLP